MKYKDLPKDAIQNAPAIPNLKCLTTSTIYTNPKYHNPTNIASPNINKAIVARANSLGNNLATNQSNTVKIDNKIIKLNPIKKLITFHML